MNPPGARSRSRRWPAILLAAGLPFLLFAGHAALFGGWVIDDAGISFAYARSLAGGDGLVAQPGTERVEGFTNLAWALLLALSMAAGLFDPVVTPKALSALLVLLTFLILARAVVSGSLDRDRDPSAGDAHAIEDTLVAGLALATAAALTPFAAWSVSGLENPLYTLLAASLAAGSLGALGAEPGHRRAIALGLLAFLLFAARPDGLLFLPLPALALGLAGGERSRRAAAIYWAAFIVPWATLTAARLLYFGDPLPNTYYAKKGPAWDEVLGLLERLGPAAGGAAFIALVAAVAAGTVTAAAGLGRRAPRTLRHHAGPAVLAAFAVTAWLDFELLPTDWMPEFRFATALALLAPLALLAVCAAAARPLPPGRRRAVIVAAGLAALLGASAYGWRHTRAFAAAPPVPFAHVRALCRGMDAVAEAAGLERAVVATPDVGGALWEDRFTVVDLAGLTDRALGRNPRGGPEAYLAYLLERRPELVWIHGYWVGRTGLPSLPGFTERYLPLPVATDVPEAALHLRRDVAGGPESVTRAARAFEVTVE